MNNYNFDIIEGEEVPQLIIREDYAISGEHTGTVQVESGELQIIGTLRGTLCVHPSGVVRIFGNQQGTVHLYSDSEVFVNGAIGGTTNIESGATLVVEEGARLAGTLVNNGRLILRGVFGGAASGFGEIVIEGNGYVKQPTIENGINYFKW